jgi:hypothetical protein
MAIEEKKDLLPERIETPAPTPWPMVTAFGLTLLCAGLVTHAAVSVVGLIVAFRGAIGWFREVLPVEKTELVSVVARDVSLIIKPSARSVTHLRAGQASHRVSVPEEYHPYSAGFIGGIFGGIAMAVVACAYGIIFQQSIWYPINLLAAAAMPSLANADVTQLRLFNGAGFVVALISHGVISLLVGLLYAVLLPMLPSRFSAFWGSLLAPLLWTGLISASLRLINPALNTRIDWIWFIASQVAYGMVTGYVVAHTKTVETVQTWPLVARAGIEAPGITSERRSGQ